MNINHLSSEFLNAKARILAEAVCARGAALVGKTAVAYDAAMAGCAHAGDVEVLEILLARLLARWRQCKVQPGKDILGP